MNQQLVTKGQKYTLKQYLDSDSMKSRIADVLPKHLTPERMVRIALLAAAREPKLGNCTPESVALALLTASQLGIEPNGRDGHLIPYGSDCQFIPDYKGLIQLAYQSGQVSSMNAKAVHANDTFDFELGMEERLQHRPTLDSDRGPLIAAWAMARLKSGRPVFVVLAPDDVNKRKGSAQTDKVWKKHPDAMWAKSAVRELAKWIPQQPEFDSFHEAVQHDYKAEYGDRDAIDVKSDPVDSLSGLTAELDAKHGMAEPEPEKAPPKRTRKKTPPKREPEPEPPINQNITVEQAATLTTIADSIGKLTSVSAVTDRLRQYGEDHAGDPAMESFVEAITEIAEARIAEIKEETAGGK